MAIADDANIAKSNLLSRRTIAADGCDIAGGAGAMVTSGMNWDDLRIVAAVRDEGTYAGASARLRIDETTVGRRLARIQRELGVPLFEAVDGLRRPTRHCEAVLDHVGAMAAHVAAV